MDYGNLPNSTDLEITVKNDEEKGYSQLKLKFPSTFNLIPFKVDTPCSIIAYKDDNFFLMLEFKIKQIFNDHIILSSKDYVDFQPIFKLGTQI